MHTGQISSSFVCFFLPACFCLSSCLIGAWNLCTTRIVREVGIKCPPPSRWSESTEHPWGCTSFTQPAFLLFSSNPSTRSSLTFGDDGPTRSTRAISQGTPEWKRNPFCCGPACDLIDAIRLRGRPPRALAKDIFNWCQGPINHPVSKRPCNAFYISTYVESERVCHRREPLSKKEVFWRPLPL